MVVEWSNRLDGGGARLTTASEADRLGGGRSVYILVVARIKIKCEALVSGNVGHKQAVCQETLRLGTPLAVHLEWMICIADMKVV